MEAYLSTIEKYIKEKQQESENQVQDVHTNDIDMLLRTNAESWLQSLPDLTDPSILAPLYLTQEPSITSEQTSTFEMPLNDHDNSINNNSQLTFVDYQQPSNNGVPIRKKPGRKPKAIPPAVRKAQNRAAQRAFRERKEKYLSELEKTVHNLKKQRQQMANELTQLKSQLEMSQTECWYLRGSLMTVQYICLLNRLKIPPHTPYLNENQLFSIKGMTLVAASAYMDARERNDKALIDARELIKISSIQKEIALEADKEKEEKENEQQIWLHEPDNVLTNQSSKDIDSLMELDTSKEACSPEEPSAREETSTREEFSTREESQSSEESGQEQSTSSNSKAFDILLGLLRPYQSGENESSLRMKPTILQQTIPHDPRINIIPLPYMRDRMILFRSLIDFERLFDLMINEAIFSGGDPTLSDSWELPPEIFEEFWYIMIRFDPNRANQWRKSKGLPEVHTGLWSTPLDASSKMGYFSPLNSHSAEGNALYESFKQLPQRRKPVYPPTLGNMHTLYTQILY